MVLNREIGEIVEGMDDIFRVVPIEKYKNQPRLTTTVRRMSGKKFRREVDVTMPIWQAAHDHAVMSFAKSGAPAGQLAYDAIAQEYPRTGCLCFIFAADINGAEMFVTAPFLLGNDQIADLELRGLWQRYTVN
jgi:hypothetical protein